MNTQKLFNWLVIIPLALLTLLLSNLISASAAPIGEFAPVESPPGSNFAPKRINYEVENKPLTATQTSNWTWTQLSPTGTPPSERYSAGNAYDEVNDRLILFSGEDFTELPRPTDVWVLTNASGAGGTPSWVQLSPIGGPPLGREGGTVVYDSINNRIIIHGGCSAFCSPALKDVWVLTNANGLGGVPNWIALPSAPIGRASHVSAYDPGSNRMIVFGGNTAFPNTDRNDVWILTDANGIGSPTWIQLFPAGSPPPARGLGTSGVVYDPSSNRLIIFGGEATGPTSFNDVWVLTSANGLGGTSQWIQLTPAGTPPTPRGGHSMVYDQSTNQMMLFGGVNSMGTVTYFNDVWILTEANGIGGMPQWIPLTPSGFPPPARFGYSVGYSMTSKQMVVAMGRNDYEGPLFNDVWVLKSGSTIYLPLVRKSEPITPPTSLFVQSINTGGINPFEVRDPNNGDALLLSCVVGNNVTEFCGSFEAITTYKVVAYPANCPAKEAIFNDALPGATVTRKVTCQ